MHAIGLPSNCSRVEICSEPGFARIHYFRSMSPHTLIKYVHTLCQNSTTVGFRDPQELNRSDG